MQHLLPLCLWIVASSLSVVRQGEPAAAESSAAKAIDTAVLGAFEFRSIGPALMSGRVSDIAVDPVEPNTWYVAAGSGGVWKTTNAGTTWRAIFDSYGSYSIGCITIDPSDHDTVWVGSGEAVGGRHVGFGDGVYVSRDGGDSFANVGLCASEHIAKIVVDPRNSQVVYVASQGPLWSPGGERGLYRTSDGGESWVQVLAAGEYTGVTDVILDPRDPDTLYAATHQRHRTVSALLNGGPESGIHKSTDGGETWAELKSGLPSGDRGKIALGLSAQDPDIVYATIELAGREGGFWRSSNAGASWKKMSDYISGGTGPHYYQELFVDPHRADVIYQANVVLGRSEDGGENWESMGNPWKHVDNHAVAFHPSDPDLLLVGCDGGLYVSHDRGETYRFTENLPLTQFYKLDVDYDWPVYHVIGGTQDNNSQYGPAWTMNENGIRNDDWRITIGGDGHDNAIDPKDPNILYCESQEGYLRRFDRQTGESVDVRPQPDKGEEDFRFNWDSPILISPHSHTRLYFGSKKLHRSDDRGDSWKSISGDLSRGRDRLLLEIMGRVWGLDATWDLFAMSEHGNITSISESPVQEGLIYVGTDDGLIQVTEDGGENWRVVQRLYGVPEFAFVNDIKADLFDAETVYACMDNHKEGDFAPYLVKSHDRGRTWESMAGNLPDRHLVWRIVQDGVQPKLFFLGTEFGIFASLDAGASWIAMKAGLPVIPFRDLAIQCRENDLIGASFGRGFYVLDDYAPMRELVGDAGSELLAQEFAILPVRKALLYVQDDELGGEKGSRGDSYYASGKRPFGAVFTYWLRDELKSEKARRKEREAKNREAGGDNPRPDWEAVKIEDREEDPALVFEIRDTDGNVVDRVDAATASGIQRVTWGLRYAPFTAGTRGFGGGPFVAPGTYSVRALRRMGDVTTPLGEPRMFDVEAIGNPSLAPQDRAATLAFQMQVGELQRAVAGTRAVIDAALGEVEEIQQLIRDGRAVDFELLDEARRIELALLDAAESLSGDDTARRRGAGGSPSIASRLGTVLYGTLNSTYGPTQTQRREHEIAREEYGSTIDAVRKAVEVDLGGLKRKLDELGAPWTAGREIPKLRRR